MKRLKIVLLMTMIILWMAGCWNRIEVNDIAIVTAIGLDWMDDGNIRLSLQIGVPARLGPIGAGGGERGRKEKLEVTIKPKVLVKRTSVIKENK